MGSAATKSRLRGRPLSIVLNALGVVLVDHPKVIDDPKAVLVACEKFSRVLAAIQAKAVMAAEDSGVVRDSGARDTADWVGNTTGESKRDARQKRRTADAVKDNPELGDGLAEGSLSPSQIDQITKVGEVTGADDERMAKFVDDAKNKSDRETAALARALERELNRDTPEERYAQQRRKRSLSIRLKNDGSGMYVMYGLFDPVTGEQIKNELLKAYKKLHDGEIEKRQPTQIMADALEHLVLGDRASGSGTGAGSGSGSASGSGGRSKAGDGSEPGRASNGSSRGSSSSGIDVVVTVALKDLIDQLNASGTITGSAEQIPISQIRRLACENGVIPVILGSQGEVLDMGRRVRLATPAQRRALKVHYGGCGIHGCDGAFEFCAIHHIKQWISGGLSDLENLIPLCTRHHHQVHDQKRVITRHDDDTVTLEPPTPKPKPP